ncbi:MAG: hypothetical protein ACYTEZ_08470 [Planctomycetota bacterium]|jgi:hypothetical protein
MAEQALARAARHPPVGKRDGMRFECQLEALLRGRAGAFPAETVNASRSGVLLQITDADLWNRHGGLVAFAERVHHYFRTGADVQFVEPPLKVRADLARVAPGGPEPQVTLRVAFRFRRNLTAERCRSLGIEDRDDGVPTF